MQDKFNVKPFPTQALVFTCLQYKSFENAVGKGEIARNEQFLLFPQCFLPVWITFCCFQNKNCHLQTLSVWKSLIFVFGKGLNYYLSSANVFSLDKANILSSSEGKATFTLLSENDYVYCRNVKFLCLAKS